MTTEAVDKIIGQEEAVLKQGVARAMQLYVEAQRVGVGVGAAAQELTKAKRALERFEDRQKASDNGGRFATLQAAAEHVRELGFIVGQRSAENHIKAGVAREKDGTYLQTKVEEFAGRTWENPSRSAAVDADDDSYKARLVKANAEMMELKLAERRGALLDAAEEEARDAAILLGIRRHLENGVPERIKRMIADLAVVMTEEQQALAMTRLPEWIELELERVADAFDLLAREGGVE